MKKNVESDVGEDGERAAGRGQTMRPEWEANAKEKSEIQSKTLG